MAGSITVTSAAIGATVTKYTIAWTSDASGNVNGTTLDLKRGLLIQAKYIPGSGGTQPSASYVATILDADSVDILGGTGAALSNSAATFAAPKVGTTQSSPFIEAGAVTPTLSGCGNAKTGTIIVLIGP